MKVFLELFWVFFKIGLFSFGGGYAMIRVIGDEVQAYGWVQAKEYADIVSISQMTPGPIAVNAATYIGVKAAGIPGSIVATIGVSLPSLILIILIATAFIKFKENLYVNAALKGIRPVTIGLIGSAVIFFAGTSIVTTGLTLEKLWSLFSGSSLSQAFEGTSVSLGALAIFLIVLVGTKKFKLHPITAVIISGLLGLVLI